MLRPQKLLARLSTLHKGLPVAAIWAPLVERLLHSWVILPSGWASSNGTAWNRPWHGATGKAGRTLRHSVIRHSRSCSNTPSKPCNRYVTAARGRNPKVGHCATEAASLGGLFLNIY